jgi:hypothetical protein
MRDITHIEMDPYYQRTPIKHVVRAGGLKNKDIHWCKKCRHQLMWMRDLKVYMCANCCNTVYPERQSQQIADTPADKANNVKTLGIETSDGLTSQIGGQGQASSRSKPKVRSWGRRRSLTNQSNTIKGDDEIEAWLSKQPSTYLIDYKETLPS